MLLNLLLSLKDWVLDHTIDWIFMQIGWGAVHLTNALNYISNFIFFWLPGVFFSIFLGVVFTNKQSGFYYKRFQEDWKGYLSQFDGHPLLRTFLRCYISAFIILLFHIAFLKTLLIFAPHEGLHVRDMFTDDNIRNAVGFNSFIFLWIIMFKACFYTVLGVIKKWYEFQLKMILY